MTATAFTGRVALLTANYPYLHNGGEIPFVAPEVPRLVSVLGQLVVAPAHASGERVATPAGVQVDTSFSSALRRGLPLAALRAPLWPGAAAECNRAARHGGAVALARAWRWAAIADVAYRWARARFDDGVPTVFYTYWRGGATLGLLRLAAERPLTAVVTRVHRHELYEDAYSPPFQPWHPAMYARLALTATVAAHGRDYLLAAGVDAARVAVHRLGTERPVAPCRPSDDGCLRIVSCSFVAPVKRVPLLASALQALAARHPQQRFAWTHLGYGPQMQQLRAAAAAAPANLAVTLRGHVEPADVMAHYQHAAADLFVLLSASEGLPVAVQEAAAVGLPVLACDVGGLAEIVGADNGLLLPADAPLTRIVDALERLTVGASAAERAALGAASRTRWHAGFDAERNFTAFALALQQLLGGLHPPPAAAASPPPTRPPPAAQSQSPAQSQSQSQSQPQPQPQPQVQAQPPAPARNAEPVSPQPQPQPPGASPR